MTAGNNRPEDPQESRAWHPKSNKSPKAQERHHESGMATTGTAAEMAE